MRKIDKAFDCFYKQVNFSFAFHEQLQFYIILRIIIL